MDLFISIFDGGWAMIWNILGTLFKIITTMVLGVIVVIAGNTLYDNIKNK